VITGFNPRCALEEQEESIRPGVESLSRSARCSTLVGFQGDALPAKAA
jgi:hypothetical protein